MSGIVKFRTSRSLSTINRVEVERETESSVWVNRHEGNKAALRQAKHGEFAQYHGTWEAAHAYLVQQATDEVNAARHALERANGKLGNIKGMPVGKVSK